MLGKLTTTTLLTEEEAERGFVHGQCRGGETSFPVTSAAVVTALTEHLKGEALFGSEVRNRVNHPRVGRKLGRRNTHFHSQEWRERENPCMFVLSASFLPFCTVQDASPGNSASLSSSMLKSVSRMTCLVLGGGVYNYLMSMAQRSAFRKASGTVA